MKGAVKKLSVFILAVLLGLGTFALVGCNRGKGDSVFTIVGLAGGRGDQYVADLVTEFKKTHDEEVRVIMMGSATIEDELVRMINAGDYPDLMFLNPNMSKKSVEKIVQGKNAEDLSGLLEENAAGESVKIKDKLIGNILNSYTTQPYGDGKTYLLPAFYSPCGLFYDADKFGTGAGKYTLPTTWDEFFALGDQLNTAAGGIGNTGTAEKPALFTYPTAGYFDGVIYATLNAIAGPEKYAKCLSFADGIWEDADVKAALEKCVKLKEYLLPSTSANATSENFKKNQQAVIDGTALFMPNGDWLPGEMIDTTPADFKWGFMPVPKKDADSQAYTTTFIETMLVHKKAEHKDLAKEFIKLYYSDKGAEIVAKANGAIIPTKSAVEKAKANGVADSTIALYDIYKSANAVIGTFAATKSVADVVWTDILFNNLNTDVFAPSVNKPVATLLNEWVAKLEAASDKLRPQIIK